MSIGSTTVPTESPSPHKPSFQKCWVDSKSCRMQGISQEYATSDLTQSTSHTDVQLIVGAYGTSVEVASGLTVPTKSTLSSNIPDTLVNLGSTATQAQRAMPLYAPVYTQDLEGTKPLSCHHRPSPSWRPVSSADFSHHCPCRRRALTLANSVWRATGTNPSSDDVDYYQYRKHLTHNDATNHPYNVLTRGATSAQPRSAAVVGALNGGHPSWLDGKLSELVSASGNSIGGENSKLIWHWGSSPVSTDDRLWTTIDGDVAGWTGKVKNPVLGDIKNGPGFLPDFPGMGTSYGITWDNSTMRYIQASNSVYIASAEDISKNKHNSFLSSGYAFVPENVAEINGIYDTGTKMVLGSASGNRFWTGVTRTGSTWKNAQTSANIPNNGQGLWHVDPPQHRLGWSLRLLDCDQRPAHD